MSVTDGSIEIVQTYSDMVCLSCIGRYYYCDAEYDAKVVCDGPPSEVGKSPSNVCDERGDESY